MTPEDKTDARKVARTYLNPENCPMVGDEGASDFCRRQKRPAGVASKNLKQALDFCSSPTLVDQEGSILHTKNLKDRLNSTITEVNEEIDYWYYLLEPAYNRYLLSRE